jgi:cytochrome c2
VRLCCTAITAFRFINDNEGMNTHASSWVIPVIFAAALAACGGGDPDRGKVTFSSRGCPYCHAIGKQGRQGPDLSKVGSKYKRDRLEKWLLDPEIIYKETGRRPINKSYPPMPRIQLTEEERSDLVAYLRTLK